MKLESCAYRDGKYGDWGEDGFFLNCSFQSSAYIWLEENRKWKWNVTAVWVVGPTEWQPNWPSAECPVCRIVPGSLLVRDYKQWLVAIFCTKEQNQKCFWSTRLEDLQMFGYWWRSQSVGSLDIFGYWIFECQSAFCITDQRHAEKTKSLMITYRLKTFCIHNSINSDTISNTTGWNQPIPWQSSNVFYRCRL